MDWRELRVGDAVRMTKVPSCVWATAPAMRDGPEGILRVYQRAVAKRSRLRVTFVDAHGFPWCEYSFVNKRGGREQHAMQIEDDSYERIDG
jgi:hypothetical protein